MLIPAGNYRIKSLFLKSNINIELAEGAVLLARHDRAALAYIPGTVTGDEGAGYAGTDMLPLGRWEGESFSTYCSTFTGLSVHDVCIYGRGAIDGQTDFAEEILCQYRFVRRSWFLIHHITVRRLHAKCDGRKAICQKINK